ncbi:MULTISPECIES: IS5 family transposase [unclassified Streptomyces]|uniref:IS5 family transposase n=1 Tax=Streptomyces TaxID=1883 RepID=UPI00211CFA3D|nr:MULTISPECIES: IS5 family transposase [unclassified Streptomyces]MDN3248528.1 IS5 family transposase [Streptomyces sp. ZSW22]MDN3256153.1 IS5 family transposase [Streptomyces sp. MA25(2023)]
MLAAIVFVATSGCTWQQLPSASFGPSGGTAHRRFAEWTKARVWAKLHRLVLDELGARGELDWSRCAIDSVNMRALKMGCLTGPNSVDRGKYGSKVHLITERTGLPLSAGISGANLHDSQALTPLEGHTTDPLSARTPSAQTGKAPRRQGVRLRPPAALVTRPRHQAPHRPQGHRVSTRLGRHRWTIERTMAWLAGCRRLHRRYERKAENFLAFTSIACTLICYRRLTK